MHGVGFLDGKSWNNGKKCRTYTMWENMLKRCYLTSYLETKPTYRECSVCDEWLIFSNFKKDVEEMQGFNLDGWQMDKDILGNGLKTYSKETCCFVPMELNMKFVKPRGNHTGLPCGVYKKGSKYIAKCSAGKREKIQIGTYLTIEEAKEACLNKKIVLIQSLADKYKVALDVRVYEALMNVEYLRKSLYS